MRVLYLLRYFLAAVVVAVLINGVALGVWHVLFRDTAQAQTVHLTCLIGKDNTWTNGQCQKVQPHR